MKLIECIPNFSEGRDLKIINKIASSVKIDGIKLIGLEPGYTANRTVLTMVGSPTAIFQAAYSLIKKSSELINMENHSGVHPCFGAVDVCPFVPLKNSSIEQCIQISKELGKKVANELKIPVYLYAESATQPERKKLANIRKGGYPILKNRIDNGFKPDYGNYNSRFGGLAIGAREILIAYNINLATKDKQIAKKIARCIRDARSKNTLKYCQAIGWYIDEYKCAQISTNITNYQRTPIYKVFEEVKELAKHYGTSVTGSEIIGLLPKAALLDCGRYYNARDSIDQNSDIELIQIAINNLGLSDLSPFSYKEKIIEEML